MNLHNLTAILLAKITALLKKTFMLKLTCSNVLQQVVHMAAARCFNCTGYAVNKMKSGVKVWQCHCDVSSSKLLFEKCSTGVAAVNILLA